MNESFIMDDLYTNRVVTLPNGTTSPNKVVIIRLSATLPIMITDDALMTEATIKSENVSVPQSDKNKLVDKAWSTANQNKDRLHLIGVAKNAMTFNRAYFYYDKKWKDIIVVPNIDTLSLAGDNIVFPLDGVRIGSSQHMTTLNLYNMLSMDTAEKLDMPEAKANIATIKSMFVTIPYSGTNGAIPTAKLTTYIGADYSYEETQSSLINFVQLGTKDEVFNGATSLPVYLYHQSSLIDHGIRNLGIKDTGAQKLYVKVPF